MLLYLLIIKQQETKVQGAFLCTLLFLLFCFGTSCNSTNVAFTHLSVLDSIDTEANTPDVPLVRLSVQNHNGMDSFILYKKGSNKYYLISAKQPKSNQKEVILPFDIKGPIYQTSDSIYVLNPDKNVIQLFNQKTNEIINFAFDSNYYYTNLFLPFKISHNKFIIYQIHKNASLLNPSQRLSYFKSKLIAEGTLSGDSISIELLDIYFPQKNTVNFFDEVYPISYYGKNSTLLYTFGHTDSIFIYSINDKTVKHITIPKKFSAQSKPFDESKMDDLSYSKRYGIENNVNFKLLADEQYIYLLQKPKAPYLTATDELNTFESVNKRILCFNYNGNLVKVIKSDASIELRNAVVVNKKLYSSKTINGKAKIYEYKLH